MKTKLRIKEILDSNNISLTRLSELSGIEKSNLSAIVNEKKKNLTLETLNKIAEGLELNIKDLFSTTDNKELTALIDYKEKLYKASNIEELEKIVNEIRKTQEEIK